MPMAVIMVVSLCLTRTSKDGLVSLDRRPNPHAYEVKYFHQNIWSKLENKVKGTVSVFNENFFVPLNNVNLVYSIEVEEKVWQTV